MLKHSGMLILHAGLVLLMLGELVTGKFAVEGNMTIEGTAHPTTWSTAHSPNWPSTIGRGKGRVSRDHPGRRLKQRQAHPGPRAAVRHGTGPATCRTPPCCRRQGGSRSEEPGDHGRGPSESGRRRSPKVAGMETESSYNFPSAYVTFYRRAPASRWAPTWYPLAHPGRGQPQQVTVDGKTYGWSLRFKRTYKPYTVYLKEFHPRGLPRHRQAEGFFQRHPPGGPEPKRRIAKPESG